MSVTKLKLAATLLVAAGVLSSSGVSAFQAGGAAPTRPIAKPNPPVDPPQAPTTDSVRVARERMKLAETTIKRLEQLVQQGVASAQSEEMVRWQHRLMEARIDAGELAAEAIGSYINLLKSRELAAKQRQQQGVGSTADVDEAAFQRLEAEKLLANLKNPPKPAPAALPAGLEAGFGGGGGGLGAGLAQEEQFFRPRKPNPADLGRNKVIEEILEKPLDMHFLNETPLEDVLKYIRQSTSGPESKFANGLPIYVEPKGLGDAEKTMASPISINLEGIPLRTTLHLLLDQLDLDYRVRDQLVYINSKRKFDEEETAERFYRLRDAQTERTIQGPGGGGGFR